MTIMGPASFFRDLAAAMATRHRTRWGAPAGARDRQERARWRGLNTIGYAPPMSIETLRRGASFYQSLPGRLA